MTPPLTDAVLPPDREMSDPARLAYLMTVSQLADREVGQLLNLVRSAMPLGTPRDVVIDYLSRIGFSLRRGLDVVEGHGSDVTPCWCSRHWGVEVPIKP